jgi:ATP-dependent DNA ligase
LGADGKSRFYDLLFRHGEPRFVAFDVLCCDGQDLRYSPLIERKYKLHSILPASSERILYCQHIEHDGEGLFRLACENDLEGIIAKHRFGPYLQEQAQWLKIRNTNYSQWAGRDKYFEHERESDPDISLWDDCVKACAELEDAKL